MNNLLEDEGNQRKLTQIKFEKTSCYFCNEWLESQSFKEHLIHCGQVLEKCPNSCNSYVQRKRMGKHLKECPKTKEFPSLITENDGDDDRGSEDNDYYKIKEFNRIREDFQEKMFILEQDISTLRSVLNEEIKQRLHLITDVGNLRKHNQISDEWTDKVGNVLNALKKCLNEESSARSNEMKYFKEDLRKLLQNSKEMENEQKTLSSKWNQLNVQFNETRALESSFRDAVEDKIVSSEEVMKAFEMTILKLENTLKGHDEENRYRFQQIQDAIDKITSEFMTKFSHLNDLNSKQMTLDFEVKNLKHVAYETDEKSEAVISKLKEFDRSLHHTHQGLADLETHLLYQKKISAIENTRGHLIWKISDYSRKLLESKDHGTIIQSPLFCNKQYGYTLRMEVSLNGIGTWKGRNIIAGLNVVPGEWDTLLEWPCRLQADIILRDQACNLSEAQDYVKTTIVKKKNENYHYNQYIHIPHKIVENRNFIRHDTIFFEVRVLKNKL